MFRHKHVVLIVDDFESTLKLYRDICISHGFEVRTASSVIDALPKLDEHVDIIVTDQEMPHLSGSDLCMMAKSKFHIPIIMVTGLRDINPTEYLKHFDTVLFKPFPPMKLMNIVKGILHGHYSFFA